MQPFKNSKKNSNMKVEKKYKVTTKTKGVLYFAELPEGTYFLQGSQDEADTGKATLYTFDGGTCLIPIVEISTGLQYRDITRSGESIQ